MSGVTLSCSDVVLGALTGALFGAASASSDIWPLVWPLPEPLLGVCCTLGAYKVEEHWSAVLLLFEYLLISAIFPWGAAASWGAQSWVLSLRTCCRRWVSLVWSCFWLIGPESGTDNLSATDERSCWCDKLDWGSKEENHWIWKKGLIILNFTWMSCVCITRYYCANHLVMSYNEWKYLMTYQVFAEFLLSVWASLAFQKLTVCPS